MRRNSTNGKLDSSLSAKCKIKLPGASMNVRRQTDEDGFIESIRRKYSKEKNLFTLRREEDPKKQNKDVLQQLHTKNNYESTTSQYSFVRRSSSIEIQQIRQRQERSKEKVAEKVENIKKISDKIKCILTQFDIESNENASIIKRSSIKKCDLNSSSIIKQQNFNDSQSRSIYSRSSSSSHFPNLSSFQQRNSLQKLDCSFFQKSNQFSPNATFDESFASKYDSIKSNSKSQIKEFISKICIQIQYDRQFRTLKHFFNLNNNPNKFQLLNEQFQSRGIKYCEDELVQEMKITDQQYDPFLQQIFNKQQYYKIVDTLIESNSYWRQNIYRKFGYSRLINQGIQQALKSKQNNGMLGVADFTKFVNLTSGNLFKNRDLIIILRRIGNDVVSLQEMYKIICKDYK